MSTTPIEFIRFPFGVSSAKSFFVVIAVLVCLFITLSMPVRSEVSDQMIEQYNQVAQGNTAMLDDVHELFEQEQKKNPSDARALFYLGATETIKGRESWLPWRKLSYTENGLARMDKALSLLDDQDNLRSINHIPQPIYLKANAAIVFTQVPEFFNYFDRGYQLFQEVLQDPALAAVPVQAKTWIYFYGIQAAKKDKDDAQLNTWLKTLTDSNVQDEFVAKAKSLANAG